jgi:anti-sigma-K factor RskA
MRFRIAYPGIAAAVALLMTLGFLAGRLTEADPAREQLEAVLAAPDTLMVAMTAPPGASARFVFAPSLGRGVLVAADLAPPAAGTIYQIWLIEEEGPQPAGQFTAGPGVTTAVVEGDVTAAQAVGVTLEPEGGSAQPTGEILLLGEF